MRALVLGAAGQLGGAMVARLRGAAPSSAPSPASSASLSAPPAAGPSAVLSPALSPGMPAASGPHEVIAFTRRDVDLADAAALVEAVAAVRPDVILNCAAYNQVDQAEDEPVSALQVNALAPRALASAAAETGATLVHYGTDFVFDGTASRPYVETDRPAPQSVYGASKLLGDWFAAQAPAHYVLRVESLFGGPMVRSSVDKIIGAIERGDEATVFVDRVVTPSYVEDVVTATLGLLDARAPFGLYHCVNSGETTWLALAEEVGRLLRRPARLVPIRAADLKLKARRPLYCALSNGKLALAGSPMPSWQEALARYLAVPRERSA